MRKRAMEQIEGACKLINRKRKIKKAIIYYYNEGTANPDNENIRQLMNTLQLKYKLPIIEVTESQNSYNEVMSIIEPAKCLD